MKPKILIIEDERRLRRILTLVLCDYGYEVKTAPDGQQGIDIWNQWLPQVVVTDLKMQPVDGMEVLKFGKLNFPDIPLIILTAFGSIETAVTAMKSGAFDFLAKPVDHTQLLEIIDQAFNTGINEPKVFENFIGSSKKMGKIKKDLTIFASTDSSVLIYGESGTGKDIAAKAIHEASDRKNRPFVKVNCSALPQGLIESELFGHKKGAFTGAAYDRKGAFLQANQGILFLDEIGDLTLELQPKLLHAVEEKMITPIGSDKALPVDVKIVSATNRNLEKMLLKSKFREDLYYRLNTVALTMPTLREKQEDINELTIFFIEKFCKKFNKPVSKISKSTMDLLIEYPWPGNVRELKNVIERIVITCDQGNITEENMPETIVNRMNHPKAQGELTSSLDMAAHEQNLLKSALKKCNWNQSNAAKELCITRSALRYRLQKYGIQK
jgi:DNA-binding NtrC family response regulator